MRNYDKLSWVEDARKFPRHIKKADIGFIYEHFATVEATSSRTHSESSHTLMVLWPSKTKRATEHKGEFPQPSDAPRDWDTALFGRQYATIETFLLRKIIGPGALNDGIALFDHAMILSEPSTTTLTLKIGQVSHFFQYYLTPTCRRAKPDSHLRKNEVLNTSLPHWNWKPMFLFLSISNEDSFSTEQQENRTCCYHRQTEWNW